MTHLLQINLGPVQGFIATARRSRDLWFGSAVLSEISKSVARHLLQAGAELVFPAVSRDEAATLEPDSDYLVANIVLAEWQAKDMNDAQKLLKDAEVAARVRWGQLCTKALEEIAKVNGRSVSQDRAFDVIDERVWNAQLGDVVEVYLAAAAYQSDGYSGALSRLRQAVGSRKSTRYFSPYSDQFSLPKSSLDGAQSSAWKPSDVSSRERTRLGIDAREELDTAGTVKRVVGRSRGFLPVSRVASQAWLERMDLADEGRQVRLALSRALEPLVKLDQCTRLTEKYAEYPWVKCMPYDTQLLYPERIDALIERGVQTRLPLDGEALEHLDKLKEVAGQAYKLFGSPDPYYGMLLADGDRMGELIDKATLKGGAQSHREISRAISSFAQHVPELMAKGGGACIYSGGDDVLGLVPLSKAVPMAKALSEAFAGALGKVAEGLGIAPGKHPTLSVGIVVAHHLEPLGDVRRLASKAEKLAKGDGLLPSQCRNALCLMVQPRSGNALAVRMRWDQESLLKQLEKWTRWLGEDNKLPRGLPDELAQHFRRCLRVLPPNDAETFEAFKRFWQAQVALTLARKQANDDVLEPMVVADLTEALVNELTQDSVKDFMPIELLRVARWLSGREDEQ